METRARYVLIGAFTLAGFVGMLGFFMWFANVQLDRQFEYYQVRFTSVSGLSNASDVRFSGLPVGRVVDVRLSPEMDGTIRVRLEIAADTPVRTDSVATIESLGVTGVAFVSIGPGSPDAPLLRVVSDETFPEIEAGRSTLQALSEDAPQLIDETLQIVQNLREVLGGENQRRVERILINVETASGDLLATLENFSGVTETVSEFAEQINRFNATLDTLSADLTGFLSDTTATVNSIGELSEQAKPLVQSGVETLEVARNALQGADSYITGDLVAATGDLQNMIAELQDQITTLGTDTRGLIETFSTTGETATARLQESRETLDAVDALIATLDETGRSFTGTSDRVGRLLDEEGAPLLSETRTLVADAQEAIASVNAVASDDLPQIVADIRAATDTASRVIGEVGENLSSASGRIDEVATSARTALDDASVTFANANETLALINDALETGDRALAAADRAFTGADRVINEDIDGILTGLETTISQLNAAIGQVSGDLPGISADLRSASQAALDTFEEIRRLAAGAAPGIQDFTTRALPQYTRLAQETRALIANLDRLAQQIQRDPARFFLGAQAPEFRR